MRLVPGAIAAAFVIAVAPLSQASGQGAAQSAPHDLIGQPEKLKPGQWVWAPELAPDGPLLVYVDLTRQVASVYRNGVRMAASTISSGKPGHETPTGVFTILQKDKRHSRRSVHLAKLISTRKLRDPHS